ncbi:MAG: 3TM-type holin [Rhodovibrionaceae bacterium]|nr:3TM-type holin [Rhodovibrionaceae bacterium]
MIGILAGPLAALAGELIDNLFETEEEKAAAKARLMALEQQGELATMQQQLSAILAEANSADPWTSRARPTFLYVMYAVIGLTFAGGVAGIWWPAEVAQAAENIARLLAAIPESLWWLFGAGYLGYTGARSFDKWRGMGR